MNVAGREVIGRLDEGSLRIGRGGRCCESVSSGHSSSRSPERRAEHVALVLGRHEERDLERHAGLLRGDCFSGLGRRKGGLVAGQLEQPGDLGVVQLERPLQGLEELDLGGMGAAIRPRHRGREPEGQLARDARSAAARRSSRGWRRDLHLGDLLRRARDRLRRSFAVDAVELGPLEHRGGRSLPPRPC